MAKTEKGHGNWVNIRRTNCADSFFQLACKPIAIECAVNHF